MYKVEFYEKENGESDIWDFLEALRIKSKTSKDARIQYNQIILTIELLAQHGTRQSSDVTKNIRDDIWELRPGKNRILYFYFKNDTFVLLHQFRKKTKKTPPKEIEKAKAIRSDYIARKESSKNENMG